MKITPVEPPRTFRVGKDDAIEIKDCARIALDADEQVTFVTEAGGEYDVVRKSWGFYATPSLNGRLQRFGLRAVLAKNAAGKFYLYLVERGREAEFDRYAQVEAQQVVCWLDTDDAVRAAEHRLARR